MTETARLRLPEIAAAQAQKHVTHNEALLALDTLVQLSVLDKDLAAPPGGPAEGDCYIVAAGATGDWTGWDGRVARYEDGAWRSYLPGVGAGIGWLAWVQDEAALYVLKAGGWEAFAGGGGVSEGSGTWTPTLDFATPGNLSVSYANQAGSYRRIGSLVYVNFRLTCTPTYTTASSYLKIGGLPFAASGGAANMHGRVGVFTSNTANLSYPAGRTCVTMSAIEGTTYMYLVADGSAAAAVILTAAQVPSGAVQDLFGSLAYLAAS